MRDAFPPLLAGGDDWDDGNDSRDNKLCEEEEAGDAEDAMLVMVDVGITAGEGRRQRALALPISSHIQWRCTFRAHVLDSANMPQKRAVAIYFLRAWHVNM